MGLLRMKIASTAVAAALLFSPTVGAASTMSAPAAQSAPNAWVTLSQLTPSGAVALAGSSAVAASSNAAVMAGSAQATTDTAYDAHGNPLPIPVIAVLLAVLGTAIYIAFIEKHHGHVTIPTQPVSPG
jgi:hypothetical protein